jgi:hypothetical protein
MKNHNSLKIKVVLICFLLISSLPSTAQVIWSKSPESLSGVTLSTFTADEYGNFYIYGGGRKSQSLDTIYLFSDTLYLKKNENFLAHFDRLGNLKWVKLIIGDTGSSGLTISQLDPSGNLQYKNGFLYINGGYGRSFLVIDNDTIQTDTAAKTILLKLNAQGAYQWHLSAITKQNPNIQCYIASDDKIYFSGNFTDSVKLGNHVVYSPAGIFLAQISPAGQVNWLNNFKFKKSSFSPHLKAVSTDHNNNIYISGIANDSISYGNNHFYATGNLPFIAKLNAAGQFQWFSAPFTAGTGNRFYLQPLHFKGNYGYLGGLINNGVNGTDTIHGFGSFLSKFDLNGNIIWNKRYSPGERTEHILSNKDGLYIGNYKQGFSVFHIDTNGIEKWNYKNNLNTNARMVGMALDSLDNLILAGTYSGPLLIGNTDYLATPTDFFLVNIINCNDFKVQLNPSVNVTIKDTQSVIFTATFPEKYEATRYYWYKNSTLTSINNDSFTLSPPYQWNINKHTVYSIVTAKYGCADTSATITVTIDRPIGIAGKEQLLKEMQVIPNPAKDNALVKINFAAEVNSTSFVVLTDLQGRILQKQDFLPGTKEILLPVNTLDAGIYLVKLYNDDRLIGVSKLTKVN